MKVSLFKKLYPIIQALVKNSDVPSYPLRRAMSKAMPGYNDELKSIVEEEEKIIEKYYNKVEPVQTGVRFDKLKDGMKQEDFNVEFKAFQETEIDVQRIEFKETDLETITVFTPKNERISMPADFMTILDEAYFIIDEPKKPKSV
jgi:hypothetical protein